MDQSRSPPRLLNRNTLSWLLLWDFPEGKSPKVSVSNSLQNIMILGDFCADGLYVTHKQMKELRIRSDNSFHWLIGDDMDTTSDTSKEHTYDRHVRVRSVHAVNPSWTWLILSFYVSLTESSCTETICWRLSCQTRPSRSISTRSFA